MLVHTDPTLVDLTIDGDTVETTPEHPFYTRESGWVTAGALWQGAHVRKADGSYGIVTAIKTVARSQPMYDLTVDTAHTFFVGDKQFLVHNTSSCPLRITRDGEGRVTDVYADLDLKFVGTTPDKAAQKWVKSFGYDDAGHAIAASLGGPGEKAPGNIFPQNPFLNHGIYGHPEWRSLENFI